MTLVRFDSNGGSYQVLSSAIIIKTFRGLYKQASQESRASAFMSAARQIGHRLMRAPLEFGEPLYRLPALRLQVRHGAIGPLLVYFAVHEESRSYLSKASLSCLNKPLELVNH